jgi:serine/threonine protein kinase
MAFTESPWLVKLHHAFQDDQHLYMVMDFMAGGDMQSLLENFEFTEDWTRFYVAEIVLAIEAVHEMG